MKAKNWMIVGVIAISVSIGIAVAAKNFIPVKKITFTENNNIIHSEKEATALKVASFIVPHHLAAKNIIENTFQRVSSEDEDMKIDRIILISPNHSNLGNGWIITADQRWKPTEKNISIDIDVINKLAKKDIVHQETEALQDEHGINDILPFVLKYFPEIPVIPMMVKEQMPKNLMDNFVGDLNGISGSSLVILSSDFSHELENNLSRFHDQKAIESIKEKKYDYFSQIDSDCTTGLYIAVKFAENKKCGNFVLAENSNSSIISGKNQIGLNTSYVSGYFTVGKQVDLNPISNIMFFGDLMLDRDIMTQIQRKGVASLTDKIHRLFWSQDVNLANLEGPITTSQSISAGTVETEPAHFKFTFKPQTADSVLKNLKINLVNLGNNHILNFGTDGLKQTKENLDSDGIKYFGSGEKDDYVVQDLNGLKIAFISYNDFFAGSKEKAIAEIHDSKNKSDKIIVYAHWGKEYSLSENEKQRTLAHQFIDAGADLIIGSHPHVVQPLEIYNGKAIFYSLGDFIFDQYFSEDVRERLTVGVSIGKNGFDFYLEPLYLEKNGELVLMDETRRDKFLGMVAENSKADNNIKENIRKGEFKLGF
jgi:gamma-polyglutamate biosynthesis protein CapA